MGPQQRRARENPESLSLWQTCRALWPWQDTRKGLYKIHPCYDACLEFWYCVENYIYVFSLIYLLITVMLLSFSQVTSRYYWTGVSEDCDETVKRCDVCQCTSNKFNKPSAQLHPIAVQDTVWHRIGIDLVGPLPETSRGNKYLITCTCYFSKWPEAAPLESKSAEGKWFPMLALSFIGWDICTENDFKVVDL